MSAKTVARISLPHFRTSAKRVTDPERTNARISGNHRATSQPRLKRTVLCLAAPGDRVGTMDPCPSDCMPSMILLNIGSNR